MWERVEIARQDSETNYFNNLMYLGEMLVKVEAAGLVAAIHNDRTRQRYTQLYRLVRADGIGEWAAAIDEILTGPCSQHFHIEARVEQRELMDRVKVGLWQHDAVTSIHRCLELCGATEEQLQTKLDGRKWFSLFATLRNKTRGHGAPQSSLHARINPLLSHSIEVFIENHRLYRRPWVYLHQNYSGKYRVSKLTENSQEFESLKSESSLKIPNGTYVFFDGMCVVELLRTDPDLSDFSFPNGGFNGKRFELISYISNKPETADAAPYLTPASELPPSETQGCGILDVQNNTFGNLPLIPAGHVSRVELQDELKSHLIEERHPIITLSGRGGIGKTSLALASLYEVSKLKRFGAILWFSARDIDLMEEGPKPVQPHILTTDDLAAEFVRLLAPIQATEPGFSRMKYLASSLGKSPLDDPILFVLDNFETVRTPAELFVWLDTYVRPPNKILITTRTREFKGDFPVEVHGMTKAESEELINTTASMLRIRKLVNDGYRNELYEKSDGHPYVIKILLGEVAKSNSIVEIKRIVASKNEILDALFERTYASLSAAAKKVFLLLSSWRSTVAEMAVDAAMFHNYQEPIDVEAAIDELRRSSLVEVAQASDKTRFISTPLVAAEFGKKKLAIDRSRHEIEQDREILLYFGATQKGDLRHGIGPRIFRLYQEISKKINKDPSVVEKYDPLMRFIARKYSDAWLQLATLHEQSRLPESDNKAKEAIRRYLESASAENDQSVAWERLAELCRKTNDKDGEIQARIERCLLPNAPFSVISFTANRINNLLYHAQFLEKAEKAPVIRRLAEVMANRIQKEGYADDYSRLAWLQLHTQSRDSAKKTVQAGLKLDRENEHCLKLMANIVRDEQRS